MHGMVLIIIEQPALKYHQKLLGLKGALRYLSDGDVQTLRDRVCTGRHTVSLPAAACFGSPLFWRASLAGACGNRTHLPRFWQGTPDLKSEGDTRAPSAPMLDFTGLSLLSSTQGRKTRCHVRKRRLWVKAAPAQRPVRRRALHLCADFGLSYKGREAKDRHQALPHPVHTVGRGLLSLHPEGPALG